MDTNPRFHPPTTDTTRRTVARSTRAARLLVLLVAIVLATAACTSTPTFVPVESASNTDAGTTIVVETPTTADVESAAAAEPATTTATTVSDTADSVTDEAVADTSPAPPAASGTSNLAAPCNHVRAETVASALGPNFSGGTSELFDELHCDLFASGEPTIPDTLAVTLIEVPNETIEFRYSDSDETVDIGGVTGYLDSFSGSVVVPAQSSDGRWGGFVVGVYGEDETAAERRAVMLTLAAEMLASR